MTLRDKLLYDRDHRRRYASRFQLVIGPDHAEAKRTREKFVVAYWIASRFRKECPYVPLIELCDPPEPDCKLTDKQGRKTGVEVTELVDQAMVERVARARAASCAREDT